MTNVSQYEEGMLTVWQLWTLYFYGLPSHGQEQRQKTAAVIATFQNSEKLVLHITVQCFAI